MNAQETGTHETEPQAGSAENGPALSETQSLIAETLRVPLDKTVRDEFTPRQKELSRELDALEPSPEKKI